MNYEDQDGFAVYGEDRIAVQCQIISRFKNEDTGKNYLVYTDGTKNEEGIKNMYVASYNPDSKEDTGLVPVASVEEWESISGFLEELRKELEARGLDR